MNNSASESTFYVDRRDRPERSMTFVEGRLTIGGVDAANISLNAQGISALHACIERDQGHFYFSNLGTGCKTTLFGLLIDVNKRVRLVDGDEFQIWFGPTASRQAYLIAISDPTSASLKITVVQDDREAGGRPLTESDRLEVQCRISPADVTVLAQYWEEREKRKAGGPSALRPRALPQHLKSTYHWKPNRDLVRPRSLAVCTWALIVLGALSVGAAFKYRAAFAPGSVSVAHASIVLSKDPPIALKDSGSTCDSCHVGWVSSTNKERVNAKCDGCHQAQGFAASIISAHRTAGITCTTCHGEHRGKNYDSQVAAFESCAKCHNADNKYVYNGKILQTPHGGTFGYPVINRVWVWKGLDDKELQAKPELAAHLRKSRANPGDQQQWRNAQFHAIHLDLARPAAGIEGIEDIEERQQKLSCTSCHKNGSAPPNVDRESPSRTCGRCHNAKMFEGTSNSKRFEAPSCASCHVEHFKDAHWATAMRITASAPLETNR